MRVDNSGVNAVGAGFYTRTDSTSTKGTGHSSSSTETQMDRTSLRATDELVGLAKTVVSTGRAQRMSAIAAAVNGGTYKTDPDSISEAIVDEHIQR